MPPIPVYNSAPLHPQAVTPQTADTQDMDQIPPPTRTYIDANPTATSATSQSANPPPPQPGARPAAPTESAQPFFADLPPPPQPAHPAPPTLSTPVITETHTITETSVGAPTAPPAQFSVPAPDNQLGGTPSKSTIYDAGSSFDNADMKLGNSPLPPSASPYETGATRTSLEHPPGYTQNPYAADGTAHDRARFSAAEEQQRQDEGVLGQVKGFLGKMGESLQKAEEGVWKAVGGKN